MRHRRPSSRESCWAAGPSSPQNQWGSTQTAPGLEAGWRKLPHPPPPNDTKHAEKSQPDLEPCQKKSCKCQPRSTNAGQIISMGARQETMGARSHSPEGNQQTAADAETERATTAHLFKASAIPPPANPEQTPNRRWLSRGRGETRDRRGRGGPQPPPPPASPASRRSGGGRAAWCGSRRGVGAPGHRTNPNPLQPRWGGHVGPVRGRRAGRHTTPAMTV